MTTDLLKDLEAMKYAARIIAEEEAWNIRLGLTDEGLRGISAAVYTQLRDLYSVENISTAKRRFRRNYFSDGPKQNIERGKWFDIATGLIENEEIYTQNYVLWARRILDGEELDC